LNINRSLTAMYDSRSAAESARDQLVGLGIATADITIRGTDTASTVSEPEEQGFWASLFMPADDQQVYREGVQRGGYMLSARVGDEQVESAEHVLESSGAMDIDAEAETWRQGGWTGSPATSSMPASGMVESQTAVSDLEGDDVVQAAEEQLVVGKREVGRGGVRVRSYVTERPVEEQVELRQERVTLERRPVDRELRAGDTAFQERTIEAVERGEEAVVSKAARVTEEIGIRKDVEHKTETVRDTVRKQEIEVEDDRSPRAATGIGTVVEDSVVDPELAGTSR
jgi:uncharacterized protein (TIGR02271 family)